MNAPSQPDMPQDSGSAIARAAFGWCPKCGQGRLFSGYLTPVKACSVCGEPLGHIRADDGPAWLTIVVVGHILAPILLGVVPTLSWPDWEIMAVISALTLFLTLILLPRAKGLFIGVIWRSSCVGANNDEKE